MNTPVLFLIFNRPDLTRKVFSRIREAQPTQLFVAADGPRIDRDGECELCEECRTILDDVDWPCEVKTLFREDNLGCRKAVSSAIAWFFENVEEGVILEDDCLPVFSFFRFAEELLERYRNDERIMAIGGSNFQQGKKRGEGSYYFSKYFHCWGWASWSRAWKSIDPDMTMWPDVRESNEFTGWFDSKRACAFWRRAFDMVWNGEMDTWDHAWTLGCWLNRGLTVLPNVNLVQNIGFREGATHTEDVPPGAPSQVSDMVFPLQHPGKVEANRRADRYTEKTSFSGYRTPFMLRMRKKWWMYCAARQKIGNKA